MQRKMRYRVVINVYISVRNTYLHKDLHLTRMSEKPWERVEVSLMAHMPGQMICICWILVASVPQILRKSCECR